MRAFLFALIVLAIQPAIAPAGRAATLGDPRVGFSAERVLVYDGHRYVGRMWSMPGEQRHEQQLPSLKPVFILRADSTVADMLLPQLHTAVEFVLPPALSAWHSRPCSASRSGTRSSTASPPPNTRSTRRSPRGACPAGCGSAATASRCAATAASPARTGRSRRCIGNCATSDRAAGRSPVRGAGRVFETTAGGGGDLARAAPRAPRQKAAMISRRAGLGRAVRGSGCSLEALARSVRYIPPETKRFVRRSPRRAASAPLRSFTT